MFTLYILAITTIARILQCVREAYSHMLTDFGTMAIFRHVAIFIAGINYSMQRMFYDVISYFICLHILKLNISVNFPMENDLTASCLSIKLLYTSPLLPCNSGRSKRRQPVTRNEHFNITY